MFFFDMPIRFCHLFHYHGIMGKLFRMVRWIAGFLFINMFMKLWNMEIKIGFRKFCFASGKICKYCLQILLNKRMCIRVSSKLWEIWKHSKKLQISNVNVSLLVKWERGFLFGRGFTLLLHLAHTSHHPAWGSELANVCYYIDIIFKFLK